MLDEPPLTVRRRALIAGFIGAGYTTNTLKQYGDQDVFQGVGGPGDGFSR